MPEPIESRPGPLYSTRHELVQVLEPQLQTGDIFFRCGNERFWGILPFSRMVAKLTGSKYSHASIVLAADGVLHSRVWLVEVAEMGTQVLRLIDWLDYCDESGFAVYRTKDPVPQIEPVIAGFASDDPDYNFEFVSDSPNYYCTQSVAEMYKVAGYPLGTERRLCEVILGWRYQLFRILNGLVHWITGAGISTKDPVYFVGNAQQGLLSSDKLQHIYTHPSC